MSHIAKYLFVLIAVPIWSNTVTGQTPLFPNSVVSNDIDFIRADDPDTYVSLAFLGRARKEMPSRISNELFDQNAFIFEATFTDGETMEIWCHSTFGTQAAAQGYAEKLGPRLGKLPVFQRNMVNHVVIHNGDAGAFAELEGQFFILYSDNMDRRISTNDLEETVFHESVHASYQFMFQNDPAWLNAQASDLSYITEYGEDNASLEDMAEAALFAYTMITYPGRLSPEIEAWITANNASRLAWFGMLYTAPSATGELTSQSKLAIYPNPSAGHWTIEVDEATAQDAIKIYQLSSGTLVKSITAGIGINQVDMSDHPDGLYMVSYNGVTTTVVKQER